MLEYFGLGGGPARRPSHEMFYVFVELCVGLYPYGVEHLVILQVLVDIDGSKGGVGTKVELLLRLPVPIDYGLKEVPPAIGGVHIPRPQGRPFTISILIEAEQGMIAAGAEVTVVGGALPAPAHRGLGGFHIQDDLLAVFRTKNP